MSSPRARQASRIVAPSATRTASPSIWSSTVRRIVTGTALIPRPPARRRAARGSPSRRRWPRSGRGRRSRRRASPGRSRRGAPARRRPSRAGARREPQQRLLLADGPDPARHALPARLVAEEGRDPKQHRDEVDGVVEGHDDARAERRAGGAGGLERELEVELVRPDEPAGRPAQEHRAQRAPAGDASGHLEQVSQRDAERRLVEAGALDAAGEAEEARAGRLLGPDPGERRAALEHDVEHVDQALDVVDDGRLGEEAGVDREGRLRARLAAVALDRVEERGLLAADVGARRPFAARCRSATPAPMTSSPRRPRARASSIAAREALPRQRVLAAEVDVGLLAAGREPGDRHRLDEGERVAARSRSGP